MVQDQHSFHNPCIAPRRKRLFAFLIDISLLGLIMLLLETILQSLKAPQGPAYFWTSSALVLAYFSIFNSEHGKGATIGKKVLKIQVINRQGQPISLVKSVFRYSPLLVLWLHGELAGLTQDMTVLASYAALAAYLYLGYAYLMLFQTKTHQLLHDLIADTLVIAEIQNKTKNSEFYQSISFSIGQLHLAVLGIGLLLCVTATVLLLSQYHKKRVPKSPQVTRTIKLIQNTLSIQKVRRGQGTIYSSPDQKRHYISYELELKSGDTLNDDAFQRIAEVIRQKDPQLSEKEFLKIRICEPRNGYLIRFRTCKGETLHLKEDPIRSNSPKMKSTASSATSKDSTKSSSGR